MAAKKSKTAATKTTKPARKKPAAKKNKKQQKQAEAAQEPLPRLSFKPVTRATWKDFAALFEERGGPSYCWCMAWRAEGDERKLGGRERKPLMKARVDDGVFIGLVGYAGGVPRAWVSVAPRDTYTKGWAEVRDGDEDEVVWAVVCFFVHRSLRRRGVMPQLIAAAKKEAKKRGATVLEAAPVDEDSPSYRFGGFVSTFDGAGFVEIGKAGSRRHVMRFAL